MANEKLEDELKEKNRAAEGMELVSKHRTCRLVDFGMGKI